MTMEVHNWSSSAHKEVHRIISYEIAPIINQDDARVQTFEIQFLQEAAKFVRDFKSLAMEADESLDKQKSLELETKRLLKASVSHDIMSIVKNGFVDVPSDFRTELDQCKYDNISYDKAYNDMQQKVERLQAQLRDLKGKSSDTPSASNTLDPLNQKLESKIIELEFQEVNYEREISHLKTTYKNLFDSIKSNRAHAKLNNLVYENAKLRAWLFNNTFEPMNNTSRTSVTPHGDKPKLSVVTPLSKKLHASMPSHSVPQPIEFNVVKHRNVIAPERISAHARTRRPQPKGNTRNAWILSASKSSKVKKNVTVEDHHRTLLLSKNQKTMSFECNNIKLAIRNDKSEIVYDTCCLNFSVVRRLGLFQAYDREHQAFHQICVEVFRNCTVGQFCDADLEVAFKRNTCFIRDLDGVDLLKGNRSTNLYTINLYDMALVSPIYLMARATPTKSWLWPQRLSHLNFDTINDLAKNDLFKYAKEHICPSCEQGKSKRALHPPKLVPNTKQRLHLLHIDLCGPMRVASINGKRYVLVIVDDYSRYTWVHFLRPKDETPEVIKNFLKNIYVRLQAPVIIVRTDNGTEFKITFLRNILIVLASHMNLLLQKLLSKMESLSAEIVRWLKLPELCRKPDISYLHVFGALCYPKNDREDICKLGAKGDIGFFIRYSANYVAYRVYNRRINKIMETMNVTFDELSAMALEQNSSRPGLQSMNSGQISSELELTYAPSTITPQRPSEHDLAILFEPLHNEYLGGRPSVAPRAIPTAPVLQNLQALTASMSFQDSAPVPVNSSNTPVSSHNVDATSQQHAQQQRNLTPSPTASTADNVPHAVFEGDLFVNPFATPSTEFAVSSTQYVDPSNMHTFYQPYLHDYQWTKDHPLEQVIGEPSRPVLIRSQLKTDGNMCIYALIVSIIKPNTVKKSLD
nr:integrase, catalytic region, zinc finger, CCHC-type, peptidase aspartic, catalytic [Tanacetum cinerariifolium]